jgi:hypothetical protein
MHALACSRSPTGVRGRFGRNSSAGEVVNRGDRPRDKRPRGPPSTDATANPGSSQGHGDNIDRGGEADVIWKYRGCDVADDDIVRANRTGKFNQ